MDLVIGINSKLLTMLAKIDSSLTSVSFLGGAGNGWPNRLAFNPSDSLTLKENVATSEKLIDFVAKNKGKLIIGYLSYDFGCQLHHIKQTKIDDLSLPDIYFLAYDNYLEETNGQIKSVGKKVVLSDKPTSSDKDILGEKFQKTMPKAKYDKLFDETMNYIKSGHIYQINLSQRLTAKFQNSPRDLFVRIAKNSQASMIGYIESPDFELLSLSPERFIKTQGKSIFTTPIKGTKKLSRGSNHAEKELLNDPKELSELSMITDLLRNDLAGVSEVDSVKITNSRATQKLNNLIHTYSTISARLKNDISPIEALLSMFPGGSITGCPKKRAMQIIEELEPNNRGAYCGSMVCITPDGNLDSNILIRTVIKKNNKLVLPVGGGIVFDSDKDREYQETLDKAQSIIDSLK